MLPDLDEVRIGHVNEPRDGLDEADIAPQGAFLFQDHEYERRFEKAFETLTGEELVPGKIEADVLNIRGGKIGLDLARGTSGSFPAGAFWVTIVNSDWPDRRPSSFRLTSRRMPFMLLNREEGGCSP